MNILYVEDCETTVELFKLSMDRHTGGNSPSLEVVGTVAEAIEIFSVKKHSSALLDWNLPDGSGLEVARHIRSLHETLPIVFLSSAMTPEHLLEVEKYYPKACLTKDHRKAYIDTIMRLLV